MSQACHLYFDPRTVRFTRTEHSNEKDAEENSIKFNAKWQRIGVKAERRKKKVFDIF
jgi:hypothetical protein